MPITPTHIAGVPLFDEKFNNKQPRPGFGIPNKERMKELEKKHKELVERVEKEKETGKAQPPKPKQDKGFYGHYSVKGFKTDSFYRNVSR